MFRESFPTINADRMVVAGSMSSFNCRGENMLYLALETREHFFFSFCPSASSLSSTIPPLSPISNDRVLVDYYITTLTSWSWPNLRENLLSIPLSRCTGGLLCCYCTHDSLREREGSRRQENQVRASIELSKTTEGP